MRMVNLTSLKAILAINDEQNLYFFLIEPFPLR